MYYFVIEHLRNIQGTFETSSLNILVHSFVSYLGTAVGRVYGGHHCEDQNESSDRLQQESLQFAPKQDQHMTKTGSKQDQNQWKISGKSVGKQREISAKSVTRVVACKQPTLSFRAFLFQINGWAAWFQLPLLKKKKKMTQGWVVYGGMRHAEPQREMFPRSYFSLEVNMLPLVLCMTWKISGNQWKSVEISVQYGRLSSNEHVVFSHSVYGVGNQ
jgi:hypothetical protein